MNVFVGTSGWSYDHWHGGLYPHGARPAERLGYYVQAFDTVELNASYYRWPAERTFAGWQRRLPAGFLMSVKAPRGLTHFKRLYEPERWLERMEKGLQALGDKRGVLLMQLPPSLGHDYARLRYFLEQLPPGQRTAVEFRHPSWHHDETFDLLAQHGVAYCVMSGAQLPCILRATAPFVYVRLHGPDGQHLYGGSYTDDDLRWWADRVQEWQGQGRDVFAYFNNDAAGNAVRNAQTLRSLLGKGSG
ncbi:MAG: DUF72 domain-containing protein [Anaerolineae bacterium]|nr:DUF72 domain-containing protein [Anaerolineae bacterium]